MPFAAARLFVFGHVADVANVAVVADVAPPCGCLFRAFPMLKSLTPICVCLWMAAAAFLGEFRTENMEK